MLVWELCSASAFRAVVKQGESEVKEMSAGLEEIAQAVAVAVEDKTLRDRIYAKCMEKFDGETNVLWQQLEADANLKSKGGWSKKVDSELGKGRKNVVVKGIGNVDAAIKKFEKLIGAPIHLFWTYPSKWDKKTVPLVAFVPFDMDPALRQTIPMFDAKGQRFELDQACTIAKERPVIIVTINERTYLNGQKKAIGLAFSHESAPANGVYTDQPSRNGKETSRLTSALFHQLNQVTIHYPYNRDEWGGGVEFFVVHFTKAQYQADGNTHTVNGSGNYMLGQEADWNADNSNAQYQFSNHRVALSTEIPHNGMTNYPLTECVNCFV
jgi:hypothetical protein